jgi:hypothetical protein
MKILLLGEFSGFNKNLKEGLIELGHEVCLISSGDGWKEISGADYKLSKYSVANTFFKKIVNLIYPFFILSKFKNYDVVHIINPFIFSNHRISEWLIKSIKKNNALFTMSACGSDPNYIDNMGAFDYAPLSREERLNFYNEKHRNRFIFIYNIIDMIIPVMYDYAKGYMESEKCSEVIPLPIKLNNIKYKENNIRDKIVIYHGITRREFKGSNYIIKALDKLEKSHGELLEIVVTERIPFKEYKKILNRCNILIDQCKSQAYGMNAIIGLGMGKVVLSGAEPKAMSFFGFNNDCPVINIIPNVNQIYEVLKALIENPNQIERIGNDGRLFAKNHHSHTSVAKKYLLLWGKELKKSLSV